MSSVTIMESGDAMAVNNFYDETGYRGQAETKDKLVIATQENKIIGAVRLVDENNVIVLRGMQVGDAYQRQGVGSAMLKKISQLLEGKECYCLPLEHLEKFYGQIGFKKIDIQEAPKFLQDRANKYKNEFNYQLIIMKK
jgi:N-acetylglutamate synthase-like GNAT family acetyltransferase